MPGNKLRLYLAFYRRQPTPNQPERYHTSLILVPKKPIDEAGRESLNSTVYHVTNPIHPQTGVATWKFDPKPSQPRTAKLMGLMLLGKVPPNITTDTITDILSSVPVKQEPGWWCHNWIWDAMPLLVSNGIIPELPNTPDRVWRTARDFVEGDTSGIPNHHEWVPTCNMAGKKIASEIAPLL